MAAPKTKTGKDRHMGALPEYAALQNSTGRQGYGRHERHERHGSSPEAPLAPKPRSIGPTLLHNHEMFPGDSYAGLPDPHCRRRRSWIFRAGYALPGSSDTPSPPTCYSVITLGFGLGTP